jgi:hypothetical protein
MEKKYLVINGKSGNLSVIRKSNSKLADSLETIFTVTLPNENFFTSLTFVNQTLAAKKLDGKTSIEFRTVDVETEKRGDKEVEKVDGKETVTSYVKTNIDSLKALETISIEAWKAPRNRGERKVNGTEPSDALDFI